MLRQHYRHIRNRSARWLGVVLTVALWATALMPQLSEATEGVVPGLDLAGVTRVHFDGRGKLFIVQSQDAGLTISASAALSEQIEVDVVGDVLFISVPKRPYGKPTFHLTLHELREVVSRGAGDVQMDSLQADELVLVGLGAGNFRMSNVAVNRLSIEAHGAGSYAMAGSATRQDIALFGAPSYRGADMQTQETELAANGAASAEVSARGALFVDVNGAASVTYRGSPKITQNIRGAGSLRQRS